MSQLYKRGSGLPPPPTVPVEFDTQINSPAIPALNILITNGGDSTDDYIYGIRTDGSSGGNTLTHQLTNRVRGTGSAAGAVNVDLITFNLGSSLAVYRFEIHISGICTLGFALGEGVGYTIGGSIKTNGASATVIDVPDIDADEDILLEGAEMSFIASGNNMVVRATGTAGQTISYNAVGTYVKIS